MGQHEKLRYAIVRVGGSLILALAVLGCSGPGIDTDSVDRSTVATVVDLGTGAVLGAAPESIRRQRRQEQLSIDGHPVLESHEVSGYLDDQADILAPLLANTPATMNRTQGTLRIVMPAEAIFSSGSTVRPVYREFLIDIADAMEGFERHLVEVAGHAAGGGVVSADQRLSEARARAVGQILAENGIAGARLLLVGFGGIEASTRADTPDNRVELVLVPLVGAG